MTPQEVVAGFIAAIESRDVDAALALLAEDVSYEHADGPIVGREMTVVLHSYLDLSTEVSGGSCARSSTATSSSTRGRPVPHRRRLVGAPGGRVLEVRDGLITLWRDYFDMSAYTSQLDALVGDG